jgi:hypothetical protein
MLFVMSLKKLIGDFNPAFANSLNFNGLFRPGETLQLFWIRDLSQVLCITRNTLIGPRIAVSAIDRHC